MAARNLVVAKCASILACPLRHFNYAYELIQLLVSAAAGWESDARSVACEGIVDVLREDGLGKTSATVIRLISAVVKRKHCQVPVDLIRCLLHMPLDPSLGIRNEEDKRSGKDAHKKNALKKKKKKKKDQKEAEVDFAEAEAELGHEAKQVQQTELLQSTFECYFRILKTLSPEELVKGNRYKKVLNAALDGIATLGHLVSVDLLYGCIALLQHLIKGDGDGANSHDDRHHTASKKAAQNSRKPQVPSTALPWSIRVTCLKTSATLLQGEARALEVDPQTLFECCFNLAMEIATMKLTDEDAVLEGVARLYQTVTRLVSQNKSTAKKAEARAAAFAWALLKGAHAHAASSGRVALSLIELSGRLLAQYPEELQHLVTRGDMDAETEVGDLAQINSGVSNPDIFGRELMLQSGGLMDVLNDILSESRGNKEVARLVGRLTQSKTSLERFARLK